MSPEETWLRLIYVGDLYGTKMLCLAKRLQHQSQVDNNTLLSCGLTARQSARFFALPSAELEQSLQWLEHPHHHLLVADDAIYPRPLRVIEDYPGALFVQGELSILQAPQLAVVGSRAHSWYGKRWGRIFCEAIASVGITITSGLAVGIDGVAHKAALNVRGKSIAVLGSGLRYIYPRRHLALAASLIDAGGALVSEFPLFMAPWPGNFPRRNRIISALSQGVFVVEAALHSGSLVTARCALEQGRDVFALPGPVGSPGSEGPHWLIKQGALAVTTPEDILDVIQSGLRWLPDEAEKSLYSTNQEKVALPFTGLLDNVGDEVTPVDVVAERAGQPVSVTVAQLLELELAGWIVAVPGGYVRLRRASHVRGTDVFV